MKTEDKFGGIRVKKTLIADANKKLKSQSQFSSLPHLTKVLICKKLGLKAEDY